MKQDNKNELFDDVLRRAFRDHAQTMQRELETEEELRARGAEMHEFSPEFERKMQKLVQETKSKKFNHGRLIQRIAAIFSGIVLGAKEFLGEDDDVL